MFAPALPAGGLAGLRFLERTYEAQLAQFSRSPSIERDVAYFLERAGEARSAEALVSDPRLLRVALGAFGLEDEVGKRAFVRRILEEGTIDPRSFANRLADPAWREVSAALGYGDLGPTLGSEATRGDLAERYRVRQFERAVGESDVDLRLVLNFRREAPRIAEGPAADRSGWFQMMGSRPLRSVIEGAFGLPESFGKLDIDAQKEVLEDRARRFFGEASVTALRDPQNVERLVERYLLTAQAKAGPSLTSPGATALQLLGAGLGAGAQAGLFRSRI